MTRTIEQLTRAIATVERCKVAFELAIDELGTTNTIHDARTIIALTLTNLRRERVLKISGEDAELDRWADQQNDRFDLAEERAEENKDKLRQQREQAERRIEERGYYRGQHNR